jgi:hypothetical protein
MGKDDRHVPNPQGEPASADTARSPEQEREGVVAEILRQHPGLTREEAEAQIDAFW